MDLLNEIIGIERIELVAKYVCCNESSSVDRQLALAWISEMAEEIRLRICAKEAIYEQNSDKA